MATGSQDVPAGRSGGKILREKRNSARRTPYDRPTPSQPHLPPVKPESPRWLTGLVSPAKFVAGGASKILSSIWNPNSWGAHSSSSSDSDCESGDDSGDDEIPSDEAIELSKQKLSQKSETLHLIEQLLVLEQFSREECDKLIKIINSRVVDSSMRGGADAGPSMIHSNTNNVDIRSQAITEAKKWVADNKVRSGLRSEVDNGIFAFKSVMTPKATEGEAGSPIDVAKSYMKARPPWASPIPINHDNSLITPSPLAADLFKERTPFSSGGGISFSSAKRDYLSAGSWNIQDEIRRVRSKATEDLLNSHRSVKLALSTLEHDTLKPSLANETSINVVGRNETINLETPKSVDEIVNLTAEGSNPVLSDMGTAQNNLTTEALLPHPTEPILEQFQGIHSDTMQNGLEKEEDVTQPIERNLGHENNSTANDTHQADNNCFFLTESPDIPIVDTSQDGLNTNDQSPTTKKKVGATKSQEVTRATRRTPRGKGRVK